MTEQSESKGGVNGKSSSQNSRINGSAKKGGVIPPPLSQVKAPAAKGFWERQLMADGRYSTLFKASSFELFVPKNKVP